MQLHGRNLIGGEAGAGGAAFEATNPATGETLDPQFFEATDEEIDLSLQLAERAFEEFRRRDPTRRAALLDAIASEIESLGDALIDRAAAETALGADRLKGERGRTVGQLRMFARLIEEGSWVGARIDRPDPDRKPAPKPDLRRMLIPVGPVVVFAASNFPLAFSVAGGDTASALAAGCPVVVNTSFNVRGEPIVCTPEDAYRCFMRTHIDSLVLGPFLLEKASQGEWKEDQAWQREFQLD